MTDWQSLSLDLAAQGYVAAPDLAMALALAVSLGRPLLLEGAAGVGKTEVAKALATARGARLIRLQCYEGLDASHAIYEWNYQRQLLAIRAAAEGGETGRAVEERIFSEDYLLKRPLLEAITQDDPARPPHRRDRPRRRGVRGLPPRGPLRLPDHDPGTRHHRATTRPIVILTANGTRDLSDALRRRCMYAFVDYPARETEIAILAARCPQIEARLAAQIVGFVQSVRKEDLEKKPGVAEMLDFAAALAGLGVNDLTADPAILNASLATLLKTQRDRANFTTEVAQRLAGIAA
jgi:MoxR-like ATPase